MSSWVWWVLVLAAIAHAWRAWGTARGLSVGAALWVAASLLPIDERVIAVGALVVAAYADRSDRAAVRS